MNLYRIELKGMTSNSTGTVYGNPYVVAAGMDEAVKRVQDYLKEQDLGFPKDRVLDKIELLAETGDCPGCKFQLFLP